MPITLDEIIDIQTTITPATPTASFGGALHITNQAAEEDGGPGTTVDSSVVTAKRYRNLAAVATDYTNTDDAPYQAASTYFQQIPYPDPLVIGYWSSTETPSTILQALAQ